MLRSVVCVLVLTHVLYGCSEQGPACDVLAERLCAASDEAFCKVVTQQAAEKLNDVAKQDECRAVLDDSDKLREVLDGVKAATRFQLNAEKPTEAKKPAKAKKASGAKQAKPNKKAAKPATGTGSPTPPASATPPSATPTPPTRAP